MKGESSEWESLLRRTVPLDMETNDSDMNPPTAYDATIVDLESTPVKANWKHTISAVSPTSPRVFSFSGIAMIIVGTLLYGIYSIVSKLSMLGKDTTAYQPSAVMFLVEIGKFWSSVVLLCREKGIKAAIADIINVSVFDWFLFAIPAALYSFTNVIDMYALGYMDPASFSVLGQSKILTTSVLWWICFRKPIKRQQWIALFLLFFGSVFVAIPSQSGDSQMFVQWPMGPLLILVQITMSAAAGTYTEYIYKKFGNARSIHLENLSMYVWGTVANAIQYFIKVDNTNSVSIVSGFNGWVWLLIVIYVTKGLIIGAIMKYFSNIVKLFMVGASIVVTGLLTFFIFGLVWTTPYCIGLTVVVTAVYLYKTDTRYC